MLYIGVIGLQLTQIYLHSLQAVRGVCERGYLGHDWLLWFRSGLRGLDRVYGINNGFSNLLPGPSNPPGEESCSNRSR